MLNIRLAILFFGLLSLGNCEQVGNIHRAKIETCAGCQLYELPDLKAFIFEDFTKYENTELKLVPGAPPIIIFFDESDNVVERVALKPLSRTACNELLEKHGFEKKKPKTPGNEEL